MEKILITGAAGFIGSQLAPRLLEDAQYQLILTDNVPVSVPPGTKDVSKVTCITADLCNLDQVSQLLAASMPLKAAFIFHGIMSSGSEADPELSRRVNLDATWRLLDALAAAQPGVRVVYASSCAVYGTPLPEVVTDATTPTPRGTYGTHKYMTEILLNEMNRRGRLDAFSLRFPTISVRPGRPTQAASSFLSGMIREPMQGERCVVPIRDRAYKAWLCGPRTLVENLVRVMDLPGDALPPHMRAIIMPGITATIQGMMDALAKVGGEDKLALLSEEEDPEVAALLRSWPGVADCSTALRLGLTKDENFEAVVREYALTLKASQNKLE